jgi:hypothetical protein
MSFGLYMSFIFTFKFKRNITYFTFKFIIIYSIIANNTFFLLFKCLSNLDLVGKSFKHNVQVFIPKSCRTRNIVWVSFFLVQL